MLPFFLVHFLCLVFLQGFPIIVSIDPLLPLMLVGVAVVLLLVLDHFQHSAQLHLHLLHALLLQLEYYLPEVAHASDYDARDCLYFACL